MRHIIFYFMFFPLLVFSCASNDKDVTCYVNPFIGTGGHGHTYPGAVMPHGLVQLSPDTRLAGWDACAGYYYDDKSIIGISHTHLSGTGIGDYGDFLFLPITGEPKVMSPNGEDRIARFGSLFSHENESASPGYYSVLLEDYGILVELTAGLHSGFHQYTYPKSENARLFIDLTTTIQERRVKESKLNVISNTEIEGSKYIQGWAQNRYVYFYAKFSKPFTCVPETNKSESIEKHETQVERAFLNFGKTKQGEKIRIKVGISFVDCEGAKKNVETEMPDWDFNSIRNKAENAWRDELSKILVKSEDEDSKTIFYTALYHSLLEPTISSDVDGRYRTMDNRINQSDTYINYSVFSLWDTFRSLNPLLTITHPETEEAMIRSLLRKYDEGGILPMWELASNYTGTMLGYHAVSLIVDAYMKGLRDFDVEKAYRASVHSSSYDTTNVSPTINRRILYGSLMPVSKYYKNTLGYIPSDKSGSSVSKGLEYAYNDWLIAEFAKELGKMEDYEYYSKLGKNYIHYYDPETCFMRGKMSDGSWRSPFLPNASNHGRSDYTEGNAWQWTWFVPHDVQGLVTLMGGQESFIAKLDSLFSVSSELVGDNVSADITGMIGQYAHGNEPSHQTVHLYNQVDQPWKTQALVDSIMYSLYFNDPDGLSGNEDCGQMSAWYVLNAMGFFSYCPGIPAYSIGRPVFDETRIQLKDGKEFIIRALNNSRSNKYIESITLNGKILKKPFFTHTDLISGGLLEIHMTDKPSINEK